MDQDTRVALVDVTRRRPGIPVARAADVLRIDYSTVQYHVRVLARHGAIGCLFVAGALRLYPPGAIPSTRERAVMDALKTARSRHVLDAVRARGPVTVTELAAGLGLPRTTTQDHLLRLERAGVLTATRDGNVKVYAPAPEDPLPGIPLPAPRSFAS